jgi:hypothetical protein
MNVSTRTRLLESFINIMERPYFSRVWVLQELHSASRISFCCGNDHRPFDSLGAIGMLIDYWMLRDARKWTWLWITRVLVDILSRIPWMLRRQKCLWTASARQRYSAMFIRHGSLALASGTRIGCRLSDVMRAMLQFDCTDVRDKLYGVLSLVDWDEANSSRIPTPDYTKDAFSLAVEILQMYLADEKVAPDDRTLLESAQQLCEVFEIAPSQRSMSKAIHPRCSKSDTAAKLVDLAMDLKQLDRRSPPFISFSPYKSLKGSYQTPPNDSWSGVQLLDEHDATRSEYAESLHQYLFIRPSSSGEVVHLTNKEGTVIAYAPKNTRTHDIYVFAFWNKVNSTSPAGMIIRTDRPGVYTMYGHAPGLARKRAYMNWVYSRSAFEVQWGAEDLLLYCWAHQNAVLAANSQARNAVWLEFGICGSTDSSRIMVHECLQSLYLPRHESLMAIARKSSSPTRSFL